MAKYVQSHRFSVLILCHVFYIKVVYFVQGSQQKEVPASIGLDSKFPLRESETPALGRGRCEGEQIPKL